MAKVAAIGAATVATALAAYGFYKLNSEAITGISQEYSQKANELIQDMFQYREWDAEFMDIADKIKINSDLNEPWNKQRMDIALNDAKRYRESADFAQKQAFDAINKSKQTDYSFTEKLDYLKRARQSKDVNRIPVHRVAVNTVPIRRTKVK